MTIQVHAEVFDVNESGNTPAVQMPLKEFAWVTVTITTTPGLLRFYNKHL